jgi:cytochrome b involved in lipid metabolism
MEFSRVSTLHVLEFCSQPADGTHATGHIELCRRNPATIMAADERALKPVSQAELSKHAAYGDCWIVIKDQVVDVTTFLGEHPGGGDIIAEFAGRDATAAFNEIGHSKLATDMIQQYVVGPLDTASSQSV